MQRHVITFMANTLARRPSIRHAHVHLIADSAPLYEQPGESFRIPPVSMYNKETDTHWSHESHELARCDPEPCSRHSDGLAFLRNPSGGPRAHG